MDDGVLRIEDGIAAVILLEVLDVSVDVPARIAQQNNIADQHEQVGVFLLLLDVHQLIETEDHIQTVEAHAPFYPRFEVAAVVFIPAKD